MMRLFLAVFSFFFLQFAGATDSLSASDQAVLAEAQKEVGLSAAGSPDQNKAKTLSGAVSESQIPVISENKTKATQEGSSAFRDFAILGIISVLGLSIVLAYKKFWARKQGQSEAAQIKIIAQHYLGPKRSMALVKVAGEYLLIGITDQNINLIKGLSLLDEDLNENAIPSNFKSALKEPAEDKSDLAFSDPNEQFSIANIKDAVASKLKNMRSLQ